MDDRHLSLATTDIISLDNSHVILVEDLYQELHANETIEKLNGQINIPLKNLSITKFTGCQVFDPSVKSWQTGQLKISPKFNLKFIDADEEKSSIYRFDNIDEKSVIKFSDDRMCKAIGISDAIAQHLDMELLLLVIISGKIINFNFPTYLTREVQYAEGRYQVQVTKKVVKLLDPEGIECEVLSASQDDWQKARIRLDFKVCIEFIADRTEEIVNAGEGDRKSNIIELELNSLDSIRSEVAAMGIN
jgi:hypothetical protein